MNKNTLIKIALAKPTLFGIATVFFSLVLSVQANSAFAANFELTQTFNNPDPGVQDAFGSDVDIDNNFVVIGEANDSTDASKSGLAHLFDTDGTLLETFLNPTPEANDGFGTAVAIDNNSVLIGAPGDSTEGGFQSGAAYLFDTEGTLQQTFLNPNQTAGDLFGDAVAIFGNKVLIGANATDEGAVNTGIAYLFDAMTGDLLRTFYDPTPGAGQRFGASLAIFGNHVLIGDILDNTGAPQSGAAHLFDAMTGDLVHTFLNLTPDFNDRFSTAVALDGNKALISAQNDNFGATDSGVAYLFDLTTKTLLHTFVNPTPEAGDKFGSFTSVDLSGNNAIIGANFDNTGAPDAGAAYLFDVTSGDLVETFLNPTPNPNDRFGRVAISGNNIVISASSDDSGALDSGIAYLFQPVPEPTTTLSLLGLGAVGASAFLKRKQKTGKP